MATWGSLQPLSSEFYTLLRYGLYLVLFFHLPVIGVLIGGSTVSLFLSALGKEKRDPACLRFSQEVMNTLWTGRIAMFLFGVIPLLIFWVIYARILFGPSPLPAPFWIADLAFLLAGFALLARYRSVRGQSMELLPVQFGVGASGLLAVLFAFFLFSGGYGILFDPGKLPLLQNHPGYFLSWNAVVKFFLFLALFFGMTGVLILLVHGRFQEGEDVSSGGYREFVRDVGSSLAGYAALVFPLFLLFDLATLPRIALSVGVFATAAVILVLALAVCLILSRGRGEGAGNAATPVAALYLLIFLAVLAHDHAAVGNAYQDRIAFLAMQAPSAEAEHAETTGPKAPAAAGRKVVVAGEEVFRKNCSGCHRFDARVVGPPLNERVPKYGGDVGKLKGFIRKPVKVNPDYPSMPALGLPEEEIDAVARYLIETVQGKKSP